MLMEGRTPPRLRYLDVPLVGGCMALHQATFFSAVVTSRMSHVASFRTPKLRYK